MAPSPTLTVTGLFMKSSCVVSFWKRSRMIRFRESVTRSTFPVLVFSLTILILSRVELGAGSRQSEMTWP